MNETEKIAIEVSVLQAWLEATVDGIYPKVDFLAENHTRMLREAYEIRGEKLQAIQSKLKFYLL